jgi:hypothetical protein
VSLHHPGQVDPGAEAELKRWAFHDAAVEAEFVCPPVGLASETFDPDPYDAKRDREERRARDEERLQDPSPHPAGVFS